MTPWEPYVLKKSGEAPNQKFILRDACITRGARAARGVPNIVLV